VAGEPMPLPEIGVAACQGSWKPSAEQLDRLRALRLSHLRVDAASLDAPAPEVAALGVPIEVAILLGDDPRRQLQQAARLAKDLNLEVARWLICEESAAFATAEAASLARSLLPSGRIVRGTRGNFAELNRNRPAPGTFDGICFPVNPQVHGTDHYTLAENCAAQRDAVQSARMFTRGAPVFVSPVTLKQQFNPVATGEEAPPPPGELPPRVDARQMSLFGAAWTVASLKHLSEAGAAGITYYQTAGWQGLMETLGGSPLTQQFRSIPGSVFPVWHILADVGEFRDGQVLPSVSSRPLDIECLALRRGSRTRLLVVNLSPEPQAVEIAASLAGPEVRVRMLDAGNADEAAVRPEAFRAARPALVAAESGRLLLTLDACALARLDWGEREET